MGRAPARSADGAPAARDRRRGGALRGPHRPASALGRRAREGGRALRCAARAARRTLPPARRRGALDRQGAAPDSRPPRYAGDPGGAMNHVLRVPWLIAGNTVRELVRSKLLHNLLLFAVLLIASSMFVAQLTIGQWDRVILDIGLAAIEVSGVLVAVLIGVGLVAGEIERRTVYPILARPVTRGAFLLGRFLGLCAMLAVTVLLMLGVLAGVLRLAGYGMSASVVIAALLIIAVSIFSRRDLK